MRQTLVSSDAPPNLLNLAITATWYQRRPCVVVAARQGDGTEATLPLASVGGFPSLGDLTPRWSLRDSLGGVLSENRPLGEVAP
jgi:hypothetical protein